MSLGAPHSTLHFSTFCNQRLCGFETFCKEVFKEGGSSVSVPETLKGGRGLKGSPEPGGQTSAQPCRGPGLQASPSFVVPTTPARVLAGDPSARQGPGPLSLPLGSPARDSRRLLSRPQLVGMPAGHVRHEEGETVGRADADHPAAGQQW